MQEINWLNEYSTAIYWIKIIIIFQKINSKKVKNTNWKKSRIRYKHKEHSRTIKKVRKWEVKK